MEMFDDIKYHYKGQKLGNSIIGGLVASQFSMQCFCTRIPVFADLEVVMPKLVPKPCDIATLSVV